MVCLHLDARETADRPPAPPATTATGIGDALEVGDTATSRVGLLGELADLEEAGLVASAERPVEGFDEPRTVYTLTERGRERAATLRDGLESASVQVVDGTTEELPLSEIGSVMTDEPAPLVTALARADDDGRVPLERRGGDGFVDREPEFSTVRETIEASLTRDGRTVVVAGPSGAGKTTLVHEAVDRVSEGTDDLVVATGASPAGTADPYAPFRQAFDALPVEADLLGPLTASAGGDTLDSPGRIETQRAARFEDVADGLREAARDRPVVLFLDNLQWAGDATLQLFAYLATTVDEWVYPLAFVGAYRPSALGGDHPLEEVLDELSRTDGYRHVSLDPLDASDTRRLLSDVVGRQRLPEEFVDLVQDRTGGNPLLVHETATHLVESGAVAPDQDVYPTSPDAVSLPEAVTDHVDHRFDRLDDPSRQLLRLGAVLGERIPGPVLAEASTVAPARHRDYVDLLVASNLWEPVHGEGGDASGAHPDDRDLQFVSGGVREAVVERLPGDLAPEYHGRVAEAFETVHDDVDDVAARVAHHHEQAGAPEPAVEHYRRAGDHARETYANEAAIEHYERALGLAGDHEMLADDQLAGLRADLAEAYRAVGRFDDVRRTVDEGLTVATEDSRTACRLLKQRSAARFNQGDLEGAQRTARRQRELAGDVGARELAADAVSRLGAIAWRQGDYDRAREQFERSLEALREVDERTQVARILNNLGVVAHDRGEFDQAVDYYERGLEMARDLDERAIEANGHNNLGLVALDRGRNERAREQFECSLDIKRDLGDRQGAANSLNTLGLVERRSGATGRAREYFDEALAVFRELGDRAGEAIALNNLGQVARLRGEYDGADEYLRASLEIRRDLGDRQGVAETLLQFGALESRRGRYDETRDWFEEALDIVDDIGDRKTEARARTSLGTLARRRGDLDSAREHLEAGLTVARDLELGHERVDALREVAELARERDDHDRAHDHLELASSTLEDVNNALAGAKVTLARARLALAEGDVATARECALEARDRFRDLGSSHLAGRSLVVAGRAAATAGDSTTASDHWRTALETFEQVGAPQDALEALRHLVETCRERGDREAARTWCRRAATVLEDAPDPTGDLHREWVEHQRDALGVD